MRRVRGLTPAWLPLVAATLFSIGDVVLAQPEPALVLAEDQRILPYVEPGQLVDIGGQYI